MLTRRQCPPTQCLVTIHRFLETIRVKYALKGWQWLLRCLGRQWTRTMSSFMLSRKFSILKDLFFIAIYFT